MTLLLLGIVAMIPLAGWLSASVPQEGTEAKRSWLIWAMIFMLALLALVVALVVLTLIEIRSIMKNYHLNRRDALNDTISQIREDYQRRQRQQTSSQNGTPSERP